MWPLPMVIARITDGGTQGRIRPQVGTWGFLSSHLQTTPMSLGFRSTPLD